MNYIYLMNTIYNERYLFNKPYSLIKLIILNEYHLFPPRAG